MIPRRICEYCDEAVGPGSLALHLKELSVDYLRLVEAADGDEHVMRELVGIERTVNELFEGMTPAEAYQNRLVFGVFKELVTRFGPRRAVH